MIQGAVAPAFDTRAFRTALGNFATGVTVVTYEYEGEYRGVTVNSFTSVSLDPPLILVSLGIESRAAQALPDRPFSVNVLQRRQESVAMQFAGRDGGGPVDWVETAFAPRVGGTLAHFVCTPWQSYQAGDHILVLGRVEEFESVDAEALVFFQGGFQSTTDQVDGAASAGKAGAA